MLYVENLTFSFPNKDLYENISFALEEGQHCAFIGTSGSGKSTLIEMILDPEKHLFDGKLTKESHVRIGYVSQFPELVKEENTTVLEYIAKEYMALQKEVDRLCLAMETAEDIEPVLEAYQNALDAIEALGGHDFESDIYKKLHLADLTKHAHQPVHLLSGGEFKLIQVIKEMMRSPELIIMDEPDVFLDFENLVALKKLLNAHRGTLLVITHNRFLLNHCFDKIIHLENKNLQEFDGNYIDYNFNLLQKKIELQELSIADDEEIARNEVLIDRLRVNATYNSEASRGKALKARVKIQERLMARRIEAPFVEITQPSIKLHTENPIEEAIGIEAKDLTIAFDEMLLDNVSFEIGSKDKVAIIGKNGSGKTTLLRRIFRNETPAIALHPDIQLAYMAQNQDEVLDDNATLLDYFFNCGFDSSEDIRRYLSKFGFDEGMLHHKIERLSGGEKTILQLAKLSSDGANFLLLDEPTSHLDTYSQIAFEKAVESYNGGLLMISHDYYTVANCVDYVLIIEDKNIRKISARKFRKHIYEAHFNKNYLAFEQDKKAFELQIENALSVMDFETAKGHSEKFEAFLTEHQFGQKYM